MKGKTIDGLKIRNVITAVKDLPGIMIREGTNHPHVLNFNGLRPCPIAESTHVKRMVLPWIKQVVENKYENNKIYHFLRQGKWD